MKKIIILSVILIAGASVVFAVGPQDGAQTGQGTGQGQQIQTQTEQQTQNRGEDQQIQTREEAEVQTQEGEGGPENLLISENPVKARTMSEVRTMIQQRKEEMEQELQAMGKIEQKVYQNQNAVREAVHALLAVEDLAQGIGPEVSQIAREFNNSVQATIRAEEKIRERSAFVKFFMGGDKDAAGQMEQEIVQNRQRIEELNRLRQECACGDETKTIIQEQIQKMEQEQERLQQLTDREISAKGIFGWIRNLFRRRG